MFNVLSACTMFGLSERAIPSAPRPHRVYDTMSQHLPSKYSNKWLLAAVYGPLSSGAVTGGITVLLINQLTTYASVPRDPCTPSTVY